ncbi:MAG: type II toxin-antitoxin system prevent-host-death family antitoxin [Phycisphaerae bacterium]|nr:type II toxin-antitoxin system prevent-host-death family antitoxin [Phycisphaerae bacterium]
MTTKRPQILERAGKPAFAVMPIEDYEAMRQRLEDLEDLALLREAERASGDAPGRPLADVLRELGLEAGSARGAKKRRIGQPVRRGARNAS